MKKMFSLALALIMALALTVPALAATPASDNSITIENPDDGQTYTAYKIFDLTKAEDAVAGVNGHGYAYTIDGDSKFFSPVTAYVGGNNGDTFSGNGLTITKTTEKTASGDYKWNVVADNTFSAAAFAQYINAFILANPSMADYKAGTADSANPTISNLGAGYYFVDSTLGSLCALDSADSVKIYEKNSKPSIEKFVQEDSNDAWGATADADFGQTVYYKLIVNTGTFNGFANSNVDEGVGTQTGVDADYVITDTLPVGQSFNWDTAIEGWTEGEDFTVQQADNVVTITLLATGKLAALAQNSDIVITYSVKFATDAVVGQPGNTNTVVLTYHGEEDEADATLYTWQMPVFKYTGEEKAPLADATFNLKKGDEVMLFDAYEINGTPAYAYNPGRGAVEEIVTDENGKFIITGLDSDIYTLTELVAPAGYNVLPAPITVEIDDEGNLTQDGVATSEIGVLNNSGTELPSTGGMGTTIFYVLGGVLMVGAAVLLVTKKKLANEQ